MRTRTHTRAHDCGAGSESAACCSSIDDAVVKAAIGSPPRHSPTSCVSNHVMHANVGYSRRTAPQKDTSLLLLSSVSSVVVLMHRVSGEQSLSSKDKRLASTLIKRRPRIDVNWASHAMSWAGKTGGEGHDITQVVGGEDGWGKTRHPTWRGWGRRVDGIRHPACGGRRRWVGRTRHPTCRGRVRRVGGTRHPTCRGRGRRVGQCGTMLLVQPLSSY